MPISLATPYTLFRSWTSLLTQSDMDSKHTSPTTPQSCIVYNVSRVRRQCFFHLFLARQHVARRVLSQ
jgi:hypothetical protein